MGKKCLLLCLGNMGKAALYDLLKSGTASEITVIDKYPKSKMDEYIRTLPFSQSVKSIEMDLRDLDRLRSLVQNERFDLIVEFTPRDVTYPVGKIAIENGTHVVTSMHYDIWTEEPEEVIRKQDEEIHKLHEIAQKKNVIALTNFGMDPGIEDALDSQAVKELDEVHEYHSYGAGFPEPQCSGNPLRYKFTWSVLGCLGSYLFPAHTIKEGRVVYTPGKEMISVGNMHILDLPEIGAPLEAFAEENVVKRLAALKVDLQKVKTAGKYICRWPGHGAFWERVAKAGLLDNTPVRVGSEKISPQEFLALVLGPQEQFNYQPGERDIALLRSDFRGLKDGKKKRVIYQVIDRRDLATGFTAMQRTVGFSIAIGAEMILSGQIDKFGILGPKDVPFTPFVQQLAKRGIFVKHEVTIED
jgi:lysine 6-dehydrogenase